MKPKLAVLPLEVWADVFESPLISRQWLAQFANQIGNRKFVEKLQKLLHDCGKHSLRHLEVSSKQSEYQATLTVATNGFPYFGCGFQSTLENCEFAECEMPENITKFKQLRIWF